MGQLLLGSAVDARVFIRQNERRFYANGYCLDVGTLVEVVFFKLEWPVANIVRLLKHSRKHKLSPAELVPPATILCKELDITMLTYTADERGDEQCFSSEESLSLLG